jgi:hypothetical protein
MYREGMTAPQNLNSNSNALSWSLIGKRIGQLYRKNVSRTKICTLPGSCYSTGPKKYYTPVVAD